MVLVEGLWGSDCPDTYQTDGARAFVSQYDDRSRSPSSSTADSADCSKSCPDPHQRFPKFVSALTIRTSAPKRVDGGILTMGRGGGGGIWQVSIVVRYVILCLFYCGR